MEKRNWKRSVTLKQRMVLCLAAFFAAFALQLALNGYQARAVQQVQDDQMGNFNAISRFQGGVESSISILEAYRWENGETEEKVKKATKKATTKKSTAKKTLPWMTKTTNKFKKLKDEAVQELTAKQQEQYAKALAKYEAEKAAEKAKKAAEKKAAAKKPAAKKKTTAKESAE